VITKLYALNPEIAYLCSGSPTFGRTDSSQFCSLPKRSQRKTLATCLLSHPISPLSSPQYHLLFDPLIPSFYFPFLFRILSTQLLKILGIAKLAANHQWPSQTEPVRPSKNSSKAEKLLSSKRSFNEVVSFLSSPYNLSN
jgi:hypothetical protein